MKLLACVACTVLVLALEGGMARAGGWGSLQYGGYQPWWNIFAKRNAQMTSEEERLQRFWHNYYDALGHYYKDLDHIDWVAYYKNHGYEINAGCGTGGACGCQRIQFAPVFASPQMQWAVPNCPVSSPPAVPGR